MKAEDCSKPSKRGENHYKSRTMCISYNLFMSAEAGDAHMNFEVAQLLKLLTEKIMETNAHER